MPWLLPFAVIVMSDDVFGGVGAGDAAFGADEAARQSTAYALGTALPDDTTTPPSARDATADGAPGGSLPALVLAWSDDHPDRVGESDVFPDLGIGRVLGRGPGDGRELRVELAQRRPGEACLRSPLDHPKLSRRQLLVVPLAIGFEVRLLAEGEMRIGGRWVKEGIVPFGGTVLLEDRFLLLAARRPSVVEARFLPPGSRGRFGEADRFGLVGESAPFWQMLDMLAFAAGTREHILLHGETGSGKEPAARALHVLSDRAGRPFISHNAAGIPALLAEAELFGHEKNYPNAGMPDRQGLIGEAAFGTLFLDEIGELPHEVQAKLLRVLDLDGQYRRLGENKPRRADVRFLAATNQPPERLKHDFAARFKLHVEVPSLGARLEDIPLIAAHLAKRILATMPHLWARFVTARPDGTPRVRLGVDLVETLIAGKHPTNIRGLETMIYQSCQQSRGRTLRSHPGRVEASGLPDAHVPAARMSPSGQVRELTPEGQAQLRTLLDGTRGAVRRAARALGLSRHQIARLAERYAIPTAGSDEPDAGD